MAGQRQAIQGGFMVYEWKSGSRLSANPQKVGEELERLEERTADSVVDAAKRKPGGELHKCFTWDDAEAAHEYRLTEARLVLRMIVTAVEVEVDGKTETVRPRAFESIRMVDEDEKADRFMAYVPIREALSNDAMRAQVVGRLRDVISEAERTAEVYASIEPLLAKTRIKLREARETLNA